MSKFDDRIRDLIRYHDHVKKRLNVGDLRDYLLSCCPNSKSRQKWEKAVDRQISRPKQLTLF